MSTFVQLSRAVDRSAATRAELAQRPVDPAQQALGAAPNRSSTIQAQLRLGHMLNHGPRMAAQMQLAQSLARRTTAAPVSAAQRRQTEADEQATQMRREPAATAHFAPQAYRPMSLRVV